MGIHEGKVISKTTKHCRKALHLHPAMGMFAVDTGHLLWDILLFWGCVIVYQPCVQCVFRAWLSKCRAEFKTVEVHKNLLSKG